MIEFRASPYKLLALVFICCLFFFILGLDPADLAKEQDAYGNMSVKMMWKDYNQNKSKDDAAGLRLGRANWLSDRGLTDFVRIQGSGETSSMAFLIVSL